ncbi:gamma-aminobutyraldehyde dehydrogenase [Pengzhenrongella frigida]|uniref:Gamma-aminobutyraldehyde dehydrogenase n=1 Tax=Pengzhenrongella frigida TaxID=1259133 RepID=A0A4Q5N0X5_9MICO|nr:gamma-aminobutyraldehyde dehydrogenase [Cellulomonas sp. HLT2-17]RYV51812.1 gamma-aminobutyraldehyde dehydrogenase [Cellulomonas sp. HLT2-17]
MSTALTPLQNFVDGAYADAASGRTAEIVDPSTGAAYATAPVSDANDVDRALQAAKRAFAGWRDTSPGERQRALLQIADAIDARADEFVTVESRNTGKPLALTASDELPPSSDHFRFFAGAARILQGVSAGEYLPGHTSFVRREPIGVCGQVTPWNYPLMMAVWKIAPALAAGNTVVLKPSDTTPASTLLLAEVVAEFLPAGVFNVVCGDRDTGRALIDHQIPDMVSITGSVRAGMEVAGSAAHDVKRVHLELGGKAPVIVFADADLAAAAAGIASGGFYNAGQDCTAATRVLVHASVHADFVAALAEQAAEQRTGAPDEAGVAFGPVNNANQLARVQGFLERLPDHARILTGGSRQGTTGFFHEATVVDGLRQDDEVSQIEIFGPVITVQTFTDEAEVVALANAVEYGLSSSVWTKDHGTAMRMSRALDFGVVWINTHIPFVSEMPHGGFKHSGYGKDLSMYSLEDYTRIKHVMTNLAG